MVFANHSIRADSQSCAAERVGAERTAGLGVGNPAQLRVVHETDGIRMSVPAFPPSGVFDALLQSGDFCIESFALDHRPVDLLGLVTDDLEEIFLGYPGAHGRHGNGPGQKPGAAAYHP